MVTANAATAKDANGGRRKRVICDDVRFWWRPHRSPCLRSTEVAPLLDVRFEQLLELKAQSIAFQRSKQWAEAYPLRLATCRLALRFLGEDQRGTATYLNNLGRNLYEQREFERAIRVYARAIELRSQD